MHAFFYALLEWNPKSYPPWTKNVREKLYYGGGILYCSFSLRGKDYYIAGFPGEKSYYGGGGTAIQHRYNDFISLNLHFSQSRYISIMRKTITSIWDFQIFFIPRQVSYIYNVYLPKNWKENQIVLYCISIEGQNLLQNRLE